MINHKQIVAQALISWLSESLNSEQDIAREGLPQIDVAYFIEHLSYIKSFQPEEFSIALVGFGVNSTELSRLANKFGFGGLRAIADDLHVAAEWRNNRSEYGRILALAKGRHPGVHTLMHFAKARSRELAQALLRWALEGNEFAMPENHPQSNLLYELANDPQLESLRSLESITTFLTAWSKYRKTEPNDAPRKALPALGLFHDPRLLAAGNIAHRLHNNFELVDKIREMPASNLREKRHRIEKYKNRKIRTSLLDILTRIEEFRLAIGNEAGAILTLDEINQIVRPPADILEPQEEDVEEEIYIDDEEEDEQQQDKNFNEACTDALLDNQQEYLENISDAYESAWKELEISQEDNIEIQFEVEGVEYTSQIEINKKMLEWLNTFCSENVWGGYFQSKETELKIALNNHQNADNLVLFNPNQKVVVKEGNNISMPELLAAWDEDLVEEGLPCPELLPLWEKFCALRTGLINFLPLLVYSPLEWLPGRHEVTKKISDYLDLSAQLYQRIQSNFRGMSDVSEGWAHATLEGLLALDIIQLRIPLDDGRVAYKAVMLPTHPLHLWRYQRLVQILRGLGNSAELSQEDRNSIYADIRRPEHFLSIIYLGSIPNGLGAKQILPVSNDLSGMATFENLINAYSGPDGAVKLGEIIGYFATLGRFHARPLRVGIINPPEPGTIMAEFIRLLNSHKFRQKSTLPCLRVEMFATPNHKDRIKSALRFDDKHRDLIEEKLSSGRLQFVLHEETKEPHDLLKFLGGYPFHILAIFDEASVRIRRRTAGRSLPMSPFCVRQHIRFEKRENLIRLEPTTDEPPFSEFMQLVNEAERGQRDSSPHAWADAESLRQTIDDLLQPDMPSSHWVFLADRALPMETGMQSVRLMQQRDGKRQTLLATRDYHRLSQILRPAFERCNLSLSQKQLGRLLEEGANLVGSGLLGLINQDGKPDTKQVLGFAGMLIAARDYRQQYPDSLIVSVDNQIARLWLHLGKKKNRSDLLTLYRNDNDEFVVEAIEVKTTGLEQLREKDARIEHAIDQVSETLKALSEALAEALELDITPLTAPRCEMFKEVLVRTCQSRIVAPTLRIKWGSWLKNLFRQDDDELPIVKLRGQVVKVLLSSSDSGSVKLAKKSPYPIQVRTLTDLRVQELVEWHQGGIPPMAPTSPPAAPTTSPHKKILDNSKSDTPSPAFKTNVLESQRTLERPISETATKSYIPPARSSTDAVEKSGSVKSLPWPPPINPFGMIGQQQAVQQLIDQSSFAKNYKEKFTDKLLVGPAGVGKSSLARKIANLLLGEQEILFNGADLRKPEMLIQKITEAGKIEDDAHQPIEINRCLIFIDEVHAITSQVSTALLSAMDDQRTTTIESLDYDFGNVIIILATTDPGKLSEAFISRPDKTWLRPYTLHELAGIVWLNGKEFLDGYDLPREVCYEIAARMRCNPRRGVRSLKEALRPYFARKIAEKYEGKHVPLSQIGEYMTHEEVCRFYDEQGIDSNGLDDVAKNFLKYLHQNGATSEERLKVGLGISNKGDFTEVDEFLQRLGLIEMTPGGRSLSKDGRRYLIAGEFSLRDKISRQRNL